MNMLGSNRSTKKEDEEPNPKTLQLAKLVQLIEPKLVSYYLEQVSTFLKNKKKDLWFPLISPNLDAFLVRMIQDSQNLKNLLPVLDERSREIAVDIIETMDANRDVYAVVHSYVNTTMDNNILVYRKVVDKTFLKSSQLASEDTCRVNSRTPLEETTVPSKLTDSTRRSVITLPFKLQWINETLSFVKDTTVSCIEYPDMSIEQAEFVYSLIRPKKADIDTDPSIQEYYISLKEALKEFNVYNEFKATFTYLSGDKVRLYLEKLPLNNNKREARLKPETNNNVSNSLDLDNLTKAQKNLARKTTMIKQLEPNFIRTTLQMIYDFIHDDTDSSLVFRNANEEQCQFLQSALAMAKSRKLHGVFDEDGRNLLRKIGKHLSTCEYFDLKIDVAKLEKDTMLRTVSIIKTPKKGFRSTTFAPRNPTPLGINNCNNAQANERVAPRYQNTDYIEPKNDITGKLSTIDTEKSKIMENAKIDKKERAIDKIETETASCIPIKNEIKPIEKVVAEKEKTSIIDKKPTIDKENKPTIDSPKLENTDTKVIDKKATDQATTINKDKKSTDSSKTVDSIDSKTIAKKATEQVKATTNKATDNPAQILRDQSVKGLGLRKTRLIEGLSTPLESDVAMRMMRQMGWEGGPLGARGEGLIEPVMPAIHLKTGAGLGHVVAKKEPKPQPQRPPQVQPQKPAQTQNQQAKPPVLSKTIHCHKPSNIRLDLLRNILQLITEEPLERIVVYSTKLVKKEIKFVENTIKVILRRGALIFNDEAMQDVFGRITAEMVTATDLQLGCFFGGDKKSIFLSKNSAPQKNCLQNQPPVEDVIPIASKYILAKFITPEMTTVLGKQLIPYSTKKSAKCLGHRVILLTTILDLINSKDTERIIKFDYAITCKQVSYMKEVVSGINNRTRWTQSTGYENHLVTVTLAALKDDVYMNAVLGSCNQHVTFQKTYIQQRSTNNTSERKNDSLEPTNNNNNNIVSKETTKLDKNDCITKNDKDDAKNDIKTVNDNDVIIISDIDATDSESIKKDNKDSDKSEIKDDTPNASFESDFESKKKEVENATFDADKEENNVIEKNKIDDEKVTSNDTDESAGSSSGASSKRPRSDTVESNSNQKKAIMNENVKYLGIAPDTYPMENVGIDEIITFQNKICEKLDNYVEKPLLECLGIKNGAIIYCCYNEFGRFVIDCLANEMRLKTINITNLYMNRKLYKVTARINSFVEINLKSLFSRVEAYNTGLKTDLWSVKDVQAGSGHVTILMEIDGNSFDFISESNFSIFAGVDKLRFNVSWD